MYHRLEPNATTMKLPLPLIAVSNKWFALALVTCAALFLGCTKEPLAPSPSSVQKKNVTPLVKRFVASAESQAKSEGFYTADSAGWYIEAGLNYSQAQAWIECLDITADTITLSVPQTNSLVDADAVYDAFNDLSELLAPLTTTEQHLQMVDVVSFLGVTTLDLVVVYFIGSGYDKGAPNTIYSTANDYYFAGFVVSSQCPCGDNQSSSSHCANKIIQQRINTANVYPMQPGEYWWGVETWSVTNGATNIPNKNYYYLGSQMADPNDDNNGYRDTRLFASDVQHSLCNTCVQNTEMSFFTGTATNGTWSAVQYIKSNHCPTKLFSHCNLIGTSEQVMIGGNPHTYLFHAGTFTYGYIGGES